jgi:hypothetical protein
LTFGVCVGAVSVARMAGAAGTLVVGVLAVWVLDDPPQAASPRLSMTTSTVPPTAPRRRIVRARIPESSVRGAVVCRSGVCGMVSGSRVAEVIITMLTAALGARQVRSGTGS